MLQCKVRVTHLGQLTEKNLRPLIIFRGGVIFFGLLPIHSTFLKIMFGSHIIHVNGFK